MVALFCAGKLRQRLAGERTSLNFSANLFKIQVIQNGAGACDSIGCTFGPGHNELEFARGCREYPYSEAWRSDDVAETMVMAGVSPAAHLGLTSTNGRAFALAIRRLDFAASFTREPIFGCAGSKPTVSRFSRSSSDVMGPTEPTRIWANA